MVFVLDKHKKPLMPCTEKRARLLLERGRAVVHRMSPFTIRLKDRTAEESRFQPLRLKLDPGSRTTGFAVLREDTPNRSEVILLGEIHHKPSIKDGLDVRRNQRHSRRNRKTRYREPRFNNRHPEKCAVCGKNAQHGSRYCRPCEKAKNFVDNGHREGRLAPSLEARVNQTLSVVDKLTRWLPITAISTEHVKFDTQLMQNPDISGVEYQQGELFGYEVREYLLEKWGRKCAYCGKEGVPLEVEHVVPRNPKRGPRGTDRISNLTLACEECNKAKGNLQPEEWLEKLKQSKRKLDQVRAENLPKILRKLKEPLRDAALVNATRWVLYDRLKKTGLSVECGTGARTKYNRLKMGLPKTHYYDACCVGESTPENLAINQEYVQVWTALGRGTRKMCNTDKYGFPVSHRTRQKMYFGFTTGDLVMAEVPEGKYAGRWVGRVAVRASGYFDIKDGSGKRICQGISYRHIKLLQRADGWQYEKIRVEKGGSGGASSPGVNAGASGAA
ncbi:HNH endonuclease [Desulfofundulus sp. TPOSR]|uniref:RNA-guided endonuclease IscB n=1 Tax=Desulfofundulus sp. TPOSR TaxID=2714340 RepID=UPI00140B926C|nr:RNA-guided endonuclease IscB [Desulfofundulus sp. TPOSR]NHM28002.1 HNH endonuclease [Desulfofundulus sp. TPOSR]